jgi:hypothetical protein
MKKFIYTFWTKPFILNQTLYKNIIFLLLSIELIKKQSRNIVIYTDEYGKLILKKFFNDIEINIDILKNVDFHTDRWSIPKLLVMNEQNEPFCHIDHDVFLWEEISERNCDVLTQSLENENQKNHNFSKFYKEIFMNFISNNRYVDAILIKHLENNDYAGYNCGFLDFYNLESCKKWTEYAIKLHNNYFNNFRHVDCVFIEQFTLYAIVKHFNFKVEELFPTIHYDNTDKFEIKNDNNIKFTHLMGSKNNDNVLHNVEQKLQEYNPFLFLKLKDNKNLLFTN